ncbi:MAG: class I SAM-dependent methyltransferase [Fuerstiella sp.]|nr:class I SAM-dependent methyltransferase [Fuerstiella sp.]MCP4509642.1 class I SAM-dependent methyltransferase [Fuerstiella sp.]
MQDQIAEVTDSRCESTSHDSGNFCPACGETDEGTNRYRFESGRGETQWSRCTSCATYYMTGEYDEAAETDHTRHMAWGNEAEGTRLNLLKENGFKATLDQIEALGYGCLSILDVGCSFGGILVEAEKRGFKCAGLDIVPEAVAYISSLGYRAQQCCSLKDCTLFSQQDPVDVISVLDAHIYWPNQPAELRAARQLLRDDGLLVIRAVTKSAFITTGRMMGTVSARISKKLIRRAIADHRFSMPLKSLLKTVEDAGFEILSASPRGAQHTDSAPLGARAAFAMGTLLWHRLGLSIAPTTLVFARKKAE